MIVTLAQLAGCLYAADAAGGRAVFLRGDAASPPPTLAVADLWSNCGVPVQPGWFIFLDAPLDAATAPAAEKALRLCLPVEATTGLAWLRYASGETSPLARVDVVLDPHDRPAVAMAVTVPFPRGQLCPGFAKGSPLRGDQAPPQTLVAAAPFGHGAAVTASGNGIAIPLFGDLAGCITFVALVGEAPGPQASVALMQVAMDPLDPFAPGRNWQIFTGVQFGFAARDDGWHLVPQEN